MTTVNPYVMFNGDCEQAFEFYRSVFGGEFQYMGRFKDMPADSGCEVGEAEKDLIMHVSLPISEQTVLMGSDTSEAFGQPKAEGNNFSVSVNCDNKDEVDRIFNALADGGKVGMPLNQTFWGSYFGMCNDKFGISWMVSCDSGESQIG